MIGSMTNQTPHGTVRFLGRHGIGSTTTTAMAREVALVERAMALARAGSLQADRALGVPSVARAVVLAAAEGGIDPSHDSA
eukprot:3058341-Prymnesium_polylepis.1